MGKANREVWDIILFWQESVLFEKEGGQEHYVSKSRWYQRICWVLLFLTIQIEVVNDLCCAQTRKNAQKWALETMNFMTRYYMQVKTELRTGLDFKDDLGKVNLDTKPH